MFQTRQESNPIPSSAPVFTRYQAVDFQRNVIASWSPKYEVWPLLHGSKIQGIASFVSSGIISEIVRRGTSLPRISNLFIGMPITAASAFTTYFFHNQIILPDLLVFNSGCSECIQVRSVIGQTLIGSAYPVMVSSFGYSMCDHIITRPNRNIDCIQMVKFYKNLLTRTSNAAIGCLFAQLIVGVLISQLQINSMFRLGSLKVEYF